MGCWRRSASRDRSLAPRPDPLPLSPSCFSPSLFLSASSTYLHSTFLIVTAPAGLANELVLERGRPLAAFQHFSNLSRVF